MPFAWTPEDERVLLLVAISQGNVQPGATLWNAMIQALGDGVTDRAVRYYINTCSEFVASLFHLPLPSLYLHTLFPTLHHLPLTNFEISQTGC